ncbi:MAG: GGDEF domain-containing protein [Peptococcaceae bacterium]|jgi:diguanylate cyclase (GGDEF)-like protein|nr:GGDEF domain-containing protein [Peptococcaceae bacterium]
MKWVPLRCALCGFVLALLTLGIMTLAPHRAITWICSAGILSAAGYCMGRQVQKLYEEIYTDKLTNIGNRNLFYYQMGGILDALKENRLRDVSLAMIDIDHFKKINDAYGHMIGDRLLSEIANILKKSTRKTDLLIRWGGEEFLVVLPNAALEGARSFMERIRSMIESHQFDWIRMTDVVTISVGITSYKELEKSGLPVGDLADMLLTTADNALYEAKKRRNEVAVHRQR